MKIKREWFYTYYNQLIVWVITTLSIIGISLFMSLVGGISAAVDNAACRKYANMVDSEYRWSIFNGCFILVDDEWVAKGVLIDNQQKIILENSKEN